jgi:hypothetical protein
MAMGEHEESLAQTGVVGEGIDARQRVTDRNVQALVGLEPFTFHVEGCSDDPGGCSGGNRRSSRPRRWRSPP